ncbi:MAG TPA: condensation domain-containing protein, partial [Thermoanaerobaculia bacterium]|nr:condensation domain-containing protein [Thermoanaerobaculia bacterium]
MPDAASRLAALSPSQRELLLRKLEKRKGGAPRRETATLPSLVPRPEARCEAFAPTDVQQAYWAGRSGLFDLSTIGANGYFELGFERFGPGDLRRLADAFARTVERHDMLRAVFDADGRQRVLPAVPFYRPTVVDLRGLGEAAVEERLAVARRRAQEARAPIDRWPLFDMVAHLLDGERMRLVTRFELLLLDGETRLLAFRDWFRFFADPEAEAEPLEVTYRDYAETWRRFRDGELFARSERHWRRRVESLPPAADLPLARGLSPTTPSRWQAWSKRVLEADAWARLRRRGSERGATPSQLVTTAFMDVLARWSTRRRFSLALDGTFNPPIHPGVDEVVGNFNSTLLVAADDWLDTFAERLDALRTQLGVSLEHQWYSGFRAVRELNRRHGESSRAAQPILFNSLLEFAARDASRAAPAADSHVRHLDAGMHAPQLQLIQTVAEYGGALFCRLKGVPASFAPDLLPTLADAFAALLQRLAEDESAWTAPWAEETGWLLPAAQRMARSAAAERLPRGDAADPWALFARRAAAAPERPALVDADGELSYGALAARAAAVADHLRSHRIGPGAVVALTPAAGRRWLIAALGTLAAGAAFVSLDRPAARRRAEELSAAGAGAALVLEDDDLAAMQPAGWDGAVGAAAAGDEPACVLFAAAGRAADRPAARLGVVCGRAALAAALTTAAERWGIGSEDRVGWSAGAGSGLTLFQALLPLLAGATVVLPGAAAGAPVWI